MIKAPPPEKAAAFFFIVRHPSEISENSVVYFALEIEIIPSSNGCRITSKTFLEKSGNSSKRKELPHCNSLIVSYKSPKMTKICTIKPFTTTKIVGILAKVENNDDICSNI